MTNLSNGKLGSLDDILSYKGTASGDGDAAVSSGKAGGDGSSSGDPDKTEKNGENDRTADKTETTDGNGRTSDNTEKNTVSGTSVKDREADTSEKDVKASESRIPRRRRLTKRMAEKRKPLYLRARLRRRNPETAVSWIRSGVSSERRRTM